MWTVFCVTIVAEIGCGVGEVICSGRLEMIIMWEEKIEHAVNPEKEKSRNG